MFASGRFTCAETTVVTALLSTRRNDLVLMMIAGSLTTSFVPYV